MLARHAKPKTILIVEDVTAVLEVLGDKFQREGFRVLKAWNGRLGFALARRYHPDIILSDIIMPHMDGPTMAQLLELDAKTARIPIIFLSVLGNGERPKEIFRLHNMLACLWKNELSLQDIVEQVKRYLK